MYRPASFLKPVERPLAQGFAIGFYATCRVSGENLLAGDISEPAAGVEMRCDDLAETPIAYLPFETPVDLVGDGDDFAHTICIGTHTQLVFVWVAAGQLGVRDEFYQREYHVVSFVDARKVP